MSSETFKSEDTLGDLLHDIWAGRGFILAGLVMGFLAGFVFIVLAVPHYEARMILAPASPLNMSASSAAQKSAISRAGYVQDVVDSFIRFEASYKGAGVAALLLRDPEITEGLSKDKRFTFSKLRSQWTAEKLSEYIDRRVHIDPIGETSLRGYRYLHPDKEFAEKFMRRLHLVTDGLIRHGMRKDVNERISYLNDAVSATYNPDHRRALTDLLMEQERLKMMVSIDQPYAASIVVPASVSDQPRWPDLFLVGSLFMAVGGFVGFVVFSVRSLNMRDDLLSVLDGERIEQKAWFVPESGNNNDKPANSDKQKQSKPMTEKTNTKKKREPSRKECDEAPEAAE